MIGQPRRSLLRRSRRSSDSVALRMREVGVSGLIRMHGNHASAWFSTTSRSRPRPSPCLARIRVEADLVSHLGEVDERGSTRASAFPSMSAQPPEVLHLSQAAAYWCMTAARAARRHRASIPRRPHRRPARREAVSRSCLHRLPTRRPAIPAGVGDAPEPSADLEELVAQLSPRPDVAPIRSASCRSRGPSESAGVPGPGDGRRTVSAVAEPVLGESNTAGGPELVPGRIETTRRPEVLPLSPGRYKVQFTASAEPRDKIETRRADALGDSGRRSRCDVGQAISEKLARLEARRFARTVARVGSRTTAPDTDADLRGRYARGSAPTASRDIPAAVRRAVRERDGYRCRFVDEQGRRCSELHRLEFHHRHPFGMGGDHVLGNISLLCPAHNRSLAEHDYGEAAVRRRLSKGARAPDV